MKAIFFSLSLLLLLEKQAAGVGIYAGGTKGHYLVKTSPQLGFIHKHNLLYGQKEAQEGVPEESIIMQTKHSAYGQDADVEADMEETPSFQGQRDLKEDIGCDEEDKMIPKTSQIQSQSQIKSQIQLKSQGAQLKSQTSRLKTLGQVKSQIKLKPQATPYQTSVSLQGAVLHQIKGKGYDLGKDLPAQDYQQQHRMVQSRKRKLRRSWQATDFLPQQSQPYDGYILQLQGQLQGGDYYTKSFHQAQGMCYCPKGGLILY
ncbi:LOW QUALITY PROTEIN: seminal vesicle secretory protein 3A-like [Psammomys obesus]|uniref:LOW QUALITY PROTEIN: seminal vesicle secretory protein 3A-like n=1 Tax=Psammomys obesus TaxID=48139 RepID=UPI0024533CEE|nr:LOW QUALITY PROTEIN: seminal vesicle secretory protein 3A-like [Psammomys obesus]